jgi:ubiquinone/menaquinone biosynthesis C-methylase UbiE
MALPPYASNVATFPEAYERWLVPVLFRPWVHPLLDRAELAAGDRVLDVACGTGIVARLAKERLGEGGRVAGVDLSEEMLAVARGLAPDVDWRQGDAAALPFGGSEQFDVILCQQGLQFFPDRPAAAREMRRVLAPGGRIAVSAWRPLEETPFFREVHEIAERQLGPFVDRRYSLGSAGEIEDVLASAGFRSVRVETMTRTVRFEDASVLARMNAMAAAGMSGASKSLSDEQRTRIIGAITDESADVVARYTGPDGFGFEIATNVATARR